MTEKENKDNKSKMIYWAPLAAAAVAAIIAYWGKPEKEAEATSIASASKVESDKLETNASPAVASSLSDQQTFPADAEIALQDASQIVQMRLSFSALPARSKRWRKRILMLCWMEKISRHTNES